MHYNRLKPFKAWSENDDQSLHQSTRMAERLPIQRYDADNLPTRTSSDDEGDALLHRMWRIHRRFREPVYDKMDDDNIDGDIQDNFAEPPQIMHRCQKSKLMRSQQLTKLRQSKKQQSMQLRSNRWSLWTNRTTLAMMNSFDIREEQDDQQTEWESKIFMHDKLLWLQCQCKNYECKYDKNFIECNQSIEENILKAWSSILQCTRRKYQTNHKQY